MPTFTPSTVSPDAAEAEVLILPVFEGPRGGPGVAEVAKAMGVDLIGVYEANGLKGKRGEVLTIPSGGRVAADAVLLAGVGRRAGAGPDTVRRAAGRIARTLGGFANAATTLPQIASRDGEAAAGAFVEGLLLGAYRFTRYKSATTEKDSLGEVILLGKLDRRKARRVIERAEAVSASVAWARDLVNTPSSDATPEALAAEARRMGRETGVKVKVWTPAELEKGGFGGILGVGRGGANTPRLIELTYQGGRAGQAPVGLVGKGITFDSGGLSIKDAKNMEWMKADKSGAAAILAVVRAVATLKAKINVVAAIPCAENMPGGRAIHPGDVITHRGGKTSEVLNTDAEGRLILADALALLAEREPVVILDAATLTGACMVALGDQVYGVFGNDRKVVREVLAAGEAEGEPGWELPLWEGYRPQIDSSVADIKNIGDRWGGAITAALFLKEFVGDVPWAHLDVAGTAYAQGSGGDYWPKGATGSPARTVIRFLLDRAASGR